MNENIIKELKRLEKRLCTEVSDAYKDNGNAYGNARFDKWQERVLSFLDTNMPCERTKFEKSLKFFGLVHPAGNTDEQDFWLNHGNRVKAYFDSLILDLENGEYEGQETIELTNEETEMKTNKVFIVHGHDTAAKIEMARVIEKLGYEAIILHEQADMSQTIIEKIESNTDVDFAVVLYTECDLGRDKTQTQENEKYLARQNVVFEHGYLIGKLGRNRVCAFVKGDVETPGDISGVVYVPMDKNDGWKIRLVNNMKAVGLVADMNKI